MRIIIWGAAPNPARKLLARSFLDFQELYKIISEKFLGVQNPFFKKGSGGAWGNAP
jgi:hypothetical protein